MNTKQEKQIVIGAAVLGAAIIGFSVYKTTKRKREAAQQQKIEAQQSEAQKPENQPAKEILNVSKTLKLGSRGNEVKTLQKWLGIAADGVFGNKTLYALQKQLGVNELDLDEYKRAVSVPRTDKQIAKIPSKATPPIAGTRPAAIVKKKETPALGSKLMAIKNRIGLFRTIKNVNGSINQSNFIGKRIMYGQDAGTFAGKNINGKWMIINENELFMTNAENVNAY